ncbi:MAG: hypothetical protein ACRDV8_12855, partial [Acidimicrobiales bacterium]
MTLLPALPSQAVAEGSARRLAAEAAGRELAAHLLSPTLAAADNPVEAMARAAVPRLREMGVVAEIVRARGDCLVVRSVAADPLAVGDGCALVAGWLDALPRLTSGLAWTVAESTCATRGHRMCMHTLMWRPAPEGSDAQEPVAAPPTLGDPGDHRSTDPLLHVLPRPGAAPVGN